MYFKIIKKDLKRKKSMNIILLIFIILTTTFVAASLKNLSVVINGVDAFLEEAGVQDYILISQRGVTGEVTENEQKILDFLDKSEEVETYNHDEFLWASATNFKPVNGKTLEFSNIIMLNSFDIQQQVFFDEDNQVIKSLKNGKIYIPQGIMDENELVKGDLITIYLENGFEKKYEIVGGFKDAFLGSNMMSNKRILFSEADYRELVAEECLLRGNIYSVMCEDVDTFEQSCNNEEFNLIYKGNWSTIKSTYILDLVIAAILLMVGICLVLISIIMLRFTIVFTVNEDYKEIGIMKAIGLRDGAIRRIYLAKYFLLAIIGAAMGFVASIPFGNVLLENITKNIVIHHMQSGLEVELFTAIITASVVTWFAYLSTGKIKKFTPMDAIRNGNNGERFERKGILKLSSFKNSATTFMAVNDVFSELKKYLILMITSMIGVWLVVMPVNTIHTLQSDNIVDWFSILRCDYFIIEENKIIELINSGNKQKHYDYIEDTKALLQEEGIEVERIFIEVVLRTNIYKGEYSYNSMSVQGLGTDTREYIYDEGVAPVYDNEVAITHVVADAIHAEIGDTVYIRIKDSEEPFVITAIYQSMTNMGEGIRFTENADLDYMAVSGNFGLQVILKDSPTKDELEQIFEKTEKVIPNAQMMTTKENINIMIGDISAQLESLKYVILVIVICINILVVILMQKMFLIREQGEMGMLKAIGFSNAAVIGWQTKRIICVLLVGILLGTMTGTLVSQITAGQVFKLMGASKIEFAIKPLEIYVIYPLIIIFTTIVGCLVTMLRVRKVSVQNMNEIE